jgi:CRP-like cAMP-binding protein
MSPQHQAPACRLSSIRATAILGRLRFFQELDPGVRAKLPSIVVSIIRSAGSIIFQEGAAPENCYVLVNGEVGVFTQPIQEGENGEELKAKRRMTLVPKVDAEEEVAIGQSKLEDTEPASMTDAILHPRTSCWGAEAISFDTGEGGNVSVDTDLGEQVNIMTGVSVFGEIALMSDQPRGASIKCNTDCEFLVIRKEDFNRVLKEEMLRAGDEKLQFLMEHVPGMRDLELPRHISGKMGIRPDYFFRRTTYRKGHFLFSQGQVAQDVLYVVFKGCLEIRRFDSSGPLPADSIMRFHRPSSSLKQKSKGQHQVCRARASASRCDGSDVAVTGTGRILGVLLCGAVFGSMPVQAPEPYSVVVASTTCELFQVVSADMAKLPRRLLDAIHDYLATSTAWRLKTYMSEPHLMPKSPARRDGTSPLCDDHNETSLTYPHMFTRLIHAS